MAFENRLPAGKVLDELPVSLYVLAHVVFLGIGIWLWLRATGGGLPWSGALLFYVISQIAFFGYFTKSITLKMAVLAEQILMVAMVLWIVLRTT